MIIIRIIQVVSFLAFASIMVWGYQMSMMVSQQQSANQAMLDSGGSSSSAKFVRPDNEGGDADKTWGMQIPKMPWILRMLTRSDPDVKLEKGMIRQVPSDIGGALDGAKNVLIFRPDDLNITRKIEFSKTVPFAAFLNDGEVPPKPEFESIYAKARTPKLMAKYCREALGSFAKSCAFIRAEVSVMKDGLYRISADFAYVPNYDMGLFTETSGYEALTTTVDVTPSYRNRSIVANNAQSRAAAFKMAERVCEEFRAVYANCAITKLVVKISPEPKETVAEKRRRLKREKRQKKKRKVSVFERKKSGFGEKGGFGKKAGFGQKETASNNKRDKERQDPPRVKGESMSAWVTVAVYALDTKDENKLVDAMGDTVEHKLVGEN